jgi:rhodanese-related sulfurtransferase
MKTAKEISIILGASFVAAFVVNYFSPAGIALVGQWDTSRGVVTARVKNEIVIQGKEIGSVDQAKKLYDTGKYIFVDARSREDYAAGHLPGAVSLPVGEFEENITAFLERYPPDASIITYCSGRTCLDSHHLADLLVEFGYDNVNVFIDGFPGWEAEGHPIE